MLNSLANDVMGDNVPLVKITHRTPAAFKAFITTPGVKHQKLKVGPIVAFDWLLEPFF
tara:strand:+ start:250 stop:423 length:174 start_codon:yes stop_codon:yes gene_type:complete